jgi:hypothetical protein
MPPQNCKGRRSGHRHTGHGRNAPEQRKKPLDMCFFSYGRMVQRDAGVSGHAQGVSDTAGGAALVR